MGIREGLFVLLGSGPKYGYQLKVEFEAATGEAWPLNVGQVYTTLQRLERDEKIEPEETDGEGRHSYRLTESGREELLAWLTTPVDRKIPTRDEVAMKVLLVLSSGVIPSADVIDAQRADTMAGLHDYTRLRRDVSPGDLAWSLQLDRLILLCQAELRWLDRVEDAIGEQQDDVGTNGVGAQIVDEAWSAR